MNLTGEYQLKFKGNGPLAKIESLKKIKKRLLSSSLFLNYDFISLDRIDELRIF